MVAAFNKKRVFNKSAFNMHYMERLKPSTGVLRCSGNSEISLLVINGVLVGKAGPIHPGRLLDIEGVCHLIGI